jgi:hypothetical protein
MNPAVGFGLFTGAALTAVGLLPAAAENPATPAPQPTSIIERMGVTMTISAVRRAIAFRPFAPSRRILGVALLPPFHGEDVRPNRGIGFEYADFAERRYALAEWPANGGTLAHFRALSPQEPDCPGAHTFSRERKPNGIVWSTPRGLIMTLQADGANDARTLELEWSKLIRRGACR